MVTAGSTKGRASGSRLRSVVLPLSSPDSIREPTVSAVRPFAALAMPNRVVRVFGSPFARSATENHRGTEALARLAADSHHVQDREHEEDRKSDGGVDEPADEGGEPVA